MQSVKHNRVLRSLRSKNSSERASAAISAGEMRLKAAVPILVSLLRDKNPEVRMRAVESLGAMRNSPAISGEIVKMLRDSDELVRAEAITALQNLGAAFGVPNLISKLKDRSSVVRSFAASSIGSLGTRAHVTTLLQGYNRERVSNARIGYLAGLYKLGYGSCFIVLVVFLKSADYRDMFAAANILLEILTRKDRAVLASILPFIIADESDTFRKKKLREVHAELKAARRA